MSDHPKPTTYRKYLVGPVVIDYGLVIDEKTGESWLRDGGFDMHYAADGTLISKKPVGGKGGE